jgi:tetratricopeptide (TPR) repeat protein
MMSTLAKASVATRAAAADGGANQEKERFMAYTDMRGLTVSTTSSEALAAYERGVDLFLRWRGGALEALNAATSEDPYCALAYCTKAYIGWRMGNVNVALDGHRGAMAAVNHVHTEREHLHVQAVDAMHRGQPLVADTLLERIGAQYPTDRIAVRLLGFICIARGDYRGGLEIANRSLDSCPEDLQFQTMKGFFLEQSGHNAEGFAYSSRALASDPGNLYAYHAVGHAYIARGDYREALETFERAASLEHYPHILWHLGEARAILGHEQFTRDYWGHTSPALPLFERIELLWRLEVLRRLPSDMTTWKDLAEQGERLLAHPEYLTIWMHHWIGLVLARAGDVEKARQQIDYLRQLPQGKASGHWSTLGADLLEGELAFMRGDYAAAERWMTPAIEHIHAMGGGSREQKDIFEDVFLELQRRLGHTDRVIELAEQRLCANPRHIPSLAAMAWAYAQTGQTALQRRTCTQLLSRAAEVGLHPHAPERLEAEQALAATA